MRKALARLVGWWNALSPADRVMYRASGLLAAGTAFVWPPLALIVPGSLYALAYFASFRRGA